jgi:hypothetical protein
LVGTSTITWQDFYASIISVQRMDDEGESLKDAVKNLTATGKLRELIR